MLFSLKERGQGMVEYALILVLVAVVVIVALSTLGGGITGVLNKVNSSMQFFCTKKGAVQEIGRLLFIYPGGGRTRTLSIFGSSVFGGRKPEH